MKKHVILLGDSIRKAYQPFVADLLRQRALVWGPIDNCRHTTHCLEQIDTWLADRPADVIHLNAGLHDLARDVPSPGEVGVIRVPLEQYKENLGRLLDRIAELQPDVPVLFATTTPVIEHLHMKRRDVHRLAADVENYNTVARAVCRERDVPINDLYACAMSHSPAKLQTGDGVHYTEEGSHVLATQVVAALRPYLVGVQVEA